MDTIDRFRMPMHRLMAVLVAGGQGPWLRPGLARPSKSARPFVTATAAPRWFY